MQTLPERLILPEKTEVGRGAIADILEKCAVFGARGVVVHGRSLAAAGVIARLLERTPPGMQIVRWQHAGGEPTLTQLSGLLDAARRHRADWIAGIGGGSVLDVAKACAGLFHAAQSPETYHDAAPVEAPGIPFIAAATTAGTGTEATTNSVLTNDITGEKKSIRDDAHIARRVILDADLLRTCPPDVIACSGMDAFTQALEAYVSRRATWLSDQWALKALELVSCNIERVFAAPEGSAAEELLVGSYLAGLALSAARLGVVHGLAHALGTRYRASHGLVCAACLPHAIEFNREAMADKYKSAGRAAGGDLLARTRHLLERLNITSPFCGKEIRDFQGIVAETLASGSTAANPRPVAEEDIGRLLERIFAP